MAPRAALEEEVVVGRELAVGEELLEDSCLDSKGGKARLCMQLDGNLVLWQLEGSKRQQAVWDTATRGKQRRLSFAQGSPHLRLEVAVPPEAGDSYAWSLLLAPGQDPTSARLEVTDDCRAAVRIGDERVWASESHCLEQPAALVPSSIIVVLVAMSFIHMTLVARRLCRRRRRRRRVVPEGEEVKLLMPAAPATGGGGGGGAVAAKGGGGGRGAAQSKEASFMDFLDKQRDWQLIFFIPLACVVTLVAMLLSYGHYWNIHSFIFSGLDSVPVSILALVLILDVFCLTIPVERGAMGWRRTRAVAARIARILLLASGNTAIALVHPQVRYYLSDHLPFYDMVSKRLTCDNSLEMVMSGADCKIASNTNLFLMLHLVVSSSFFLTARESVFSAVGGIAAYFAVVALYARPSAEFFGDYSGAAFVVCITLVLLAAKFKLEVAQRKLFVDHFMRQREAEHGFDTLQSCLRSHGSDDRSMELPIFLQEEKSSQGAAPLTAATARFFGDLLNPDSVLTEALQSLVSLGSAEHWLIHGGSIKVAEDHDQVLGTGSFGAVRAALWHGSPVAIKMAKYTETLQGLKALRALVDELRVLRHIRHPNIALCYGACVVPGNASVALILELVDGISLGAFVTGRHGGAASRGWRAGPPDNLNRFHLMDGICRGLRYLHERKPRVVHGDLKPSNVMVTGDGHGQPYHPKLLDFGLARVLSGASAAAASAAKTPLSSGVAAVRWMAPEALVWHQQFNRDLDKGGGVLSLPPTPSMPADIFSFGLLIFFIATGQEPGVHLSSQGGATVRLPLTWPEETFPRACGEVTAPMVQVKPSDRPAAQDVAASLDSLFENHGEVLGFLSVGGIGGIVSESDARGASKPSGGSSGSAASRVWAQVSAPLEQGSMLSLREHAPQWKAFRQTICRRLLGLLAEAAQEVGLREDAPPRWCCRYHAHLSALCTVCAQLHSFHCGLTAKNDDVILPSQGPTRLLPGMMIDDDGWTETPRSRCSTAYGRAQAIDNQNQPVSLMQVRHHALVRLDHELNIIDEDVQRDMLFQESVEGRKITSFMSPADEEKFLALTQGYTTSAEPQTGALTMNLGGKNVAAYLLVTGTAGVASTVACFVVSLSVDPFGLLAQPLPGAVGSHGGEEEGGLLGGSGMQLILSDIMTRLARMESAFSLTYSLTYSQSLVGMAGPDQASPRLTNDSYAGSPRSSIGGGVGGFIYGPGGYGGGYGGGGYGGGSPAAMRRSSGTQTEVGGRLTLTREVSVQTLSSPPKPRSGDAGLAGDSWGRPGSSPVTQRYSSNRPISRTMSKSPRPSSAVGRSRVLLRDFTPTPAETIDALLALMCERVNFHMPVRCCCAWHGAMQAVERRAKLFLRLPCHESFRPKAIWQCQVCQSMHDADDFECELCATRQCPSGGLVGSLVCGDD